MIGWLTNLLQLLLGLPPVGYEWLQYLFAGVIAIFFIKFSFRFIAKIFNLSTR